MIQLSDKGSENQCIYVDVKKAGKPFRFYSVHLQSIRFDPDDYRYLNNVSKQDGKPEVGSAKRLGAKLKTAFLKRSEQVFKVKAHAATCQKPKKKTKKKKKTPTTKAVAKMSEDMKNTFTEQGSGLGRTYNGSFPNYQIDYVLATPQFEVLDYYIIEKRLSDHYPVRADLELK